jgi:hypothetical protein
MIAILLVWKFRCPNPNLFTQSFPVFNHLLFFAVLLYTLLTSELFAFKICSKNLIVANCKQRIYDHAIHILNCSIRECLKLEFFQNVFKINERPAYTDICKFKEDRSTLCKFRISAHSLEIEKGRYL